MVDPAVSPEEPATVLVVDDDAIVAEIYRLALTRAGLNVLVANDGQSGLQKALEAKPDFIFLDIRMPKMDGIEVLRRLGSGAGTSTIPVVMLSNFDDAALVKSSLTLGAKEYLVKVNMKPSDLAAVVSRWTNR